MRILSKRQYTRSHSRKLQFESLENRTLLSITPNGSEKPLDEFVPSLPGFSPYGRSQYSYHPSSAMNKNGDFVVAWEASSSNEVNAFHTVPNTNGKYINVAIGSSGPSIDAERTFCGIDELGNFDIAWLEPDDGFFIQRYDANGTPNGSVIHLFGNAATPDVTGFAMEADDSFVLTWEGRNGVGSTDGIYSEHFSSTGVADSNGILTVNTDIGTGNTNLAPAVAVDPSGNYVVTWANGTPAGNSAIYYRYFKASSNSFTSSPIVVSSSGNFTADALPNVAMDSFGDFAISWYFDDANTNTTKLLAQAYTSNQTLSGGQVTVDSLPFSSTFSSFVDASTASSFISGSRMSMDNSGNYVVTWSKNTGSEADHEIVKAQAISLTGSAIDEVQVNTYYGGAAIPASGMSPKGDFVVAWVDRAYLTHSNGDPVNIDSSNIQYSGGIEYQLYHSPFDNSTRPPEVTGVTIARNASGTVQDFYNVPTGSGEQLRTVPIGNANEIMIQFNEAVDQTNLGSYLSLVSRFQNATYTVASGGFGYDSSTHTAHWIFTSAFPADQIEIHLSDSVKDLAGNALDGEWTNPTSLSQSTSTTFPSGNGTAGGNFVFYFTILPGDANRDNIVNQTDSNLVTNHWLQSGKKWLLGEGDMTGEGLINQADLNLVYGNWLKGFAYWPS